MAAVFTTSPGVANQGIVGMFAAETVDPGAIRMQGWGGFTGFRSILTNITIQEHGSYQFLHTFGNHIYLYLFGDRIGNLGVSGLSFGATCDSGNETHGIANVQNSFYRRRRVSTLQARTDVYIPGILLRSYMTGFRAQVVDPARNMFQFHIELALLPD